MFEKIINIGMRTLGIFYVAFSSGIVRLAIALILLFGTYSKPIKKEKC